MIINPTLPYGFVVFCDDVREEITGKLTIVGTYAHHLIFQTGAPATLVQLTVATWYRIKPDEAPSTLEFRLLFETDAGQETILYSAKIDLPEPQLSDESLSTRDPQAQAFNELRHVMRVYGVTFDQPGRLKVRVYFGENEVRIGTLIVGFADQAAAPQIATPEAG